MTRDRSRPILLVGAAVAAWTAALAACGPRAAARPEPAATSFAGATLPPAEQATIALPITLSLGAVRARLDQALPRSDSLGRAECSALGGVVCHQYVYRRDTLDVRMTDDRVDVLARLHYRARVALPRVGGLGSCGYAPEAMRRAELRFGTSLYWRTDWRLASRATTLAAALPDPCEITALRLDATPIMRRMADAQLAALTQQVDSALPAVADLRAAADSLWRTMQQPVALDSATSLWLVLAPETVALVPITGRGNVVTTGLALTARPRVVAGARPAVRVRPLPSLTLARPSTGLRVPVDVQIPFDDVSRRATALLAAETAGKDLVIRAVRVRGAGDSAVVQLDMSGTLDATLSLVGRPRYDERTRALVVDDLRYTVASRNLMSRMKATLGAPLVKRAIDQATGHGRMPLGQQLDSLRVQLTHQLNRPLAPDVAIGGGIRSLRVLGLFTTDSAFVLRVVLDGEAGLWAR